ncbi:MULTISPECIES: hypothetical protein [Bacillus cereus group]|uniref:Uncharacterized protein n=1 Tax=Bacillus cereus VD021 TaxID=1053224 RepID=R8HF65_BACCE|nr:MULTISPECIES: hypothetical protein [Bacillus cereus group]EOO71495.1 hypothetical protein IIC_04355 [Bacillus cereus VD021]MCQ6569292.1 hypothetical protein [Bacillus mycoides]
MELDKVIMDLTDAGFINKEEFDKKVEAYKQDAPAVKLAQDHASVFMLVAEKDLQLSKTNEQLVKTNQQLLETNEQQATLLMVFAEKGGV